MKIKEQIQNELAEINADIILIHSDIRHGFEIPIRSEADFFSMNIDELKSLIPGRGIWMPAFNYDFSKEVPFDTRNTPSQVGALTEYFRKNVAEWRTPVPFFSFAGTEEQPKTDISRIVDPVGPESAFQALYDKGALLMHYGSSFSTTTILHFAERMSGCLSYRYDKVFPGKVITSSGKEVDVVLNYHVRPLNKHLDYDWDKIEKDLVENQILHSFAEGRTRLSLCKIMTLTDYWKERIMQDPLYLLDSESRMWAEPFLDKLGRPFLISDFEGEEKG
jgi:aminoglycoside N3'-acetyltransferase